MKKLFFAIFVLSFFLMGAAASADTTMTVNWTNPTTYIDGTAIAPADAAKAIVNGYVKTSTTAWANIFTSAAGATSWTGVVVGVTRGVPYSLTVDWTLNGATSAKLDPPIPFTAPYLAPNMGSAVTVTFPSVK